MIQEDDKLINMIQSSTRGLLASFRTKAELLNQCSEDVKQFLREGYDVKIAREAAKKLFGEDKTTISFLAIDRTQSQDQELDMLIFYAGTYGYTGQLDFTDEGCSYDEPSEIKASMNISAAIPVHEEDASSIVGKLTEGGIEVDTERLPSTLMQLAEYYMAVRTLYAKPEINVILLDRMPSIDAPHLIGNAIELLESNQPVLLGMNTPFGEISNLDLEFARMLHPNDVLQVPFPRSQLIKYAAINHLIKGSEKIDDAAAKVTYKDIFCLARNCCSMTACFTSIMCVMMMRPFFPLFLPNDLSLNNGLENAIAKGFSPGIYKPIAISEGSNPSDFNIM